MFGEPIGGWLVGGRDRGCAWPGSVGAIGWMCRPHCWQYANPIGVEVPQRGHVIVLPCATGGEIGARATEGADGRTAGTGVASGPLGGNP
jgi:hypothetical protein